MNIRSLIDIKKIELFFNKLLKNRKICYSSNSIYYILMILGILILINIISIGVFFRFDLTKSGRYKISRESKEIIRSLDENVTIKVYISSDLPAGVVDIERQMNDVLKEYSAYSRGKIRIEYYNADEQKVKREAISLGIQQVEMSDREDDKIIVKKGIIGISLFYEDRHQVIPYVDRYVLDNLEYNISVAIAKLKSQGIKKIGYLQGHGEKDFLFNYTTIRFELAKQYLVEGVFTAEGECISDEFDTLIIAGPESMDEWSLYQIDQFIMRGGKVIFLIDSVKVDMEQDLKASPLYHGLEAMLSHHGIIVNNNLVLDMQCTEENFTKGYAAYTLLYPFSVLASRNNFNHGNPIIYNMEELNFLFISTISISSSAVSNVKPLIKSSKKSWVQEKRFKLEPNMISLPIGNTTNYNLAVIKEGEFISYFKDKKRPERRGKKNSKTNNIPAFVERCSNNRFIVIADSDFVSDISLKKPVYGHQSKVMFLNCVDWLTLDDNLIKIRAKNVLTYPQKEISRILKSIIKYGNIFGPVILIILFGFYRIIIRKKIKSGRIVKFNIGEPNEKG